MKYIKTYESFTNINIIGYHGSPMDFENFNFDYINLGDLFYGYGIYFTNTIEKAKNYGKIVKKCLLNINNSLIINMNDDKESIEKYIQMRSRNGLFDFHLSPIELTKKLISLGYDSIIVEKNNDILEIVVFDLKNIKIVDTI